MRLPKIIKNSPNDVSIVKLVPDVSVRPGRAVEVFAGHAEGGDEHRHATEQEDRTGYRKEATHQDKSKIKNGTLLVIE